MTDYSKANCRRYPQPDRFFPDTYADSSTAVCQGCPIKQACLDEHLGEAYGVWGGTTPRDREILRGRAPTVSYLKASRG